MNRFFRGGVQPTIGTGVTTHRPLTTPYYPTTPYTMPTPLYAPPQQQANFNPMQTMIPNQTNIIWVENESEIANYPSGRGWQQWFGDKNDSILYVRDTDNNGNPQPIVKIRYEVIDSGNETVQPVQEAKFVPTEEPKAPVYDGPSREEFDKLSASVNVMLEKLGDLLK